MRPLCFVLMPFGRKPDGAGGEVDFDAVYRDLIQPAIEGAELDPVRADEEMVGGIVHKPMFERLILCDFAVADLTTANANVFYELGVRHAVRPYSTVLMFAQGGRLPFDLALDRIFPYKLDASGRPIEVELTREALLDRLEAARAAQTDSPVFQLVDGFAAPDIARLKTDVFRDRVQYSTTMKRRLADAREEGVGAVRSVESELGDVSDADAAVVIDLLLSYRALGNDDGWQAMVDLVGQMSVPLAGTVMVQEQYGLALNRLGRRREAIDVLTELIDKRGPSSETCAILGRVFKDQWSEAVAEGKDALAKGYLDQAVTTYLRGFEADWRDAYPGINAVTLMEIRDPPDPRAHDLIPVVRYAATRRLAAGQPDYWDHATLIELAVLGRDEAGAVDALSKALVAVREAWEPKSTANNLAMIRRARERRGDADAWAKEVEDALVAHEV
ncbi:MAG: TRAFs-binding domain-containing protein [Acidimicrobiales bacterium]